MGEPGSFEQKLRQLRGQRLQDLPPETLRALATSLNAERAVLETELDALQASLASDLEQADARRFRQIQSQARRLGEAYVELGDDLEDVHRALRYRILEDRLIAKLGSRFRLMSLDIFVAILICLVLVLLFWEFTAGMSPATRLSSEVVWNLFLIDTACCVVFMGDFFLRLSCADSKIAYIRAHWIDFVTSLPIPPGDTMSRFVRLGRLLRFVRVLRFFRLLRVAVLFWRGMDKLKEVTDVKLMKRSLWYSFVALLFGGIAVVQFERYNAAGELIPQVSTYPEGLWWSFTTMVVGGYGDIYNPESLFGRLVTVGLVLVGMILVGIFTATLTAIVVGDESEEFRNQMEDMKDAVDQISARIDAWERE